MSNVGQDQPHESGIHHVCGSALYADDVPLPADTLHVATGKASIAYGRVEHMDLSRVWQQPGVVDVVVAADVPGSLDVSPVYPGDLLLVDQTVEFHAQPLFAVAATSERAARQACLAAQVRYATGDPILNVDESLAAEAFVLPTRTWCHSDPQPVLSQSANQVQGELYIRGQEHFYLESQAAFAQPTDDGVFVCSSTQHPTEIQTLVAEVLHWPMHKVQVECRRMGGGFGGKESQAGPLACLAALFAVRNQRAVKYRMPRQDDMVQTGKRHDFNADYQVSFDDQGVITAARFELAGKCGYSPDLSEGIVDRAMFHVDNAYHLPHASITGYRCKTHTVSNTAFRGFGGPQGMVAMEHVIDEIAHSLSEDPLNVRKRNLYAPGRELTPYGQQVEQFILAELIEKLEASADYWSRRKATREFNQQHHDRKRGLALTPVKFGISFTATHLNQAGALVHVYTDGSVSINHGGTEMGQGLYTKVAQVAASCFGLPLDRIASSATRTDKVPNTSPTAASSGSDLNGMAVLDACEKIKRGLQAFARETLGWQDPLRFEQGMVRCGSEQLSFAEFVMQARMARTKLTATGYYKTPDIHWDKEKGVGQPFYYFATGAAVSEVEVQTLTGEYSVKRVDILHDVGRSLNPAIDRGQIEGGFIQGMGWLTTEELLWDEQGRVISNSPANYKIPSAHDCPAEFNVELFGADNHVDTVHKSKAVGEPPLMLAISVWCALRDACAAAGNYQVLPKLAVPATPEQVYWAIQEAQSNLNAESQRP